jgi:hypothetical protein
MARFIVDLSNLGQKLPLMALVAGTLIDEPSLTPLRYAVSSIVPDASPAESALAEQRFFEVLDDVANTPGEAERAVLAISMWMGHNKVDA